VGEMQRSARLSPCGRYRYYLERRWAEHGSVAVFYLCNPSTADATEDDATVRKCIGFAMRWKCAAVVIVNPFALRSRDPKALKLGQGDLVGPENYDWVREAAFVAKDTGGPFVAGWGLAHGCAAQAGRRHGLRGHAAAVPRTDARRPAAAPADARV
jgi:hypothetical protein